MNYNINMNSEECTASKNEVGRPTVMSDETVRKLEESLKGGMTVSQACVVSDVSRDTYYRHYKMDEAFSDKMRFAKSYVAMLAKQNIAKAIADGDIGVSKWFLEKQSSFVAYAEEKLEEKECLNNVTLTPEEEAKQMRDLKIYLSSFLMDVGMEKEAWKFRDLVRQKYGF